MDAAVARRLRRPTRRVGRLRAALAATIALAATAACVAPGSVVAPAGAVTTQKGPNAAEPKAWIIVDADSGKVLASKAPHTPYHPASVSKIMTALTAVERLDPAKGVTVSADAIAPGLSNLTSVGMQAGQKWPLDTTLALLMIASANDAAYSLAETTSGSLQGFADAETALGARIGLKDSTFNDPAGLDDSHSFGGGPFMSAYDIAISVRNAMHVTEINKWASTSTYDYSDPTGAQHHLVNHNKLLPGLDKAYLGANGFKTGHTTRAGSTLAATATRDNRTLIVVVLDTWDTFGWTAKFFDDGFAMAAAPAGAEVLPAPKTTSYAQRSADRAGFLALVRSIPSSSGGSQPTVTTYVPDKDKTTTTKKGTKVAAAATTSGKSTTTKAAKSPAGSSDSGGFFTLPKVALTFVLLLAAAVVIRRRQVVRRRAKRAAQRRQLQAAMRRGSLPVVDGRYRAGMRTGPPVQSHVRLHRGED